MPRTHPIFEILELIEAIVSWMPPHELIHTALVNQKWFHASIPYLWQSVSLKGALSPLGQWGMRRKGFCFIKTSTKTQWARFLMYSKHVRLLEGSSLEGRLLRAATRFRPSLATYLFPNLRVLTWKTMRELTDLSALISPSLQSFGLKVPELTVSSFQSICHLLTNRLNVLRCLQIEVVFTSQTDIECDHLLQQLLTHFATTLMWIQLPNIFYTEETLRRLHGVQRLCNLSIGTHHHSVIEEIPLSWTEPQLFKREGNFDSLKSFSFSGSQEKLCDKLLNRYILSALIDFTWHSCGHLDDADSFITTLVYSCPQLATLTIGDSQIYFHTRRLPPVIQWPTLRPLLRLKNLSALSLHCCRVQMAPRDLIELLTSREAPRTWKVLEIFHVTPLRVSDISTYSKHCPDLERLGINIDGYLLNYILPPSDHNEYDIDELTELHPLPRRRFSRLAVIDFAYSKFHWTTSLAVSSILLRISEIPIVAAGWDWPYWHDVSARVLARWEAGEGTRSDAGVRSGRSTPSSDERW
ncbi:hypothetical protein Clacol_005062 [Clathrus columnatus]|uniref:F-box domain-containing protein n=1 Tax=Clathrus columnatus TaxID=1419009 RepID=A0AAV5ACA6_9AGAM|nr:hypothetical protein Clacol_005062 [Clathrus columnatus]